MDIYPLRCDRLREQLKTEEVDAFLITNPLNVTYLTGFSGEASYLIVTPTRLLLDQRWPIHASNSSEECPDLETVIRPPKRADNRRDRGSHRQTGSVQHRLRKRPSDRRWAAKLERPGQDGVVEVRAPIASNGCGR